MPGHPASSLESVPPPSPRPSLLRVLLHSRHLQTHAAFAAEYEKTARRIDRALIGTAPGREQLQRWLSGRVKTQPRPHHCRVLERMFPGHTAAELFAPYQSELTGAQRRQAGPGMGPERDDAPLTGGRALADDALSSSLWHGPDRLEAALDRRTAGTARLDLLDAEADRLGARVVKVSPSTLLEDALLELGSVRELLADRQPTAPQQRLARIGAKFATVIGEILFNDNHFALARRWYRTARRAATESGDRQLTDITLAGEAYLPTYAGEPGAVLSMVNPRLDAGPAPSPAISWLWAFKALAHAALGEATDFERSIGTARVVLERSQPDQVRPGIFSFRPEKLDFYEARGRGELGDSDGAAACARRALTGYDPTDTQEPALVRLEHASALAHDGELDEACRVATSALTAPATYLSAPVVIRAREFDSLLGPTTRTTRDWRDFLDGVRLPDPLTLA